MTLDRWAEVFARHRPCDQTAALDSCLALILILFLATLAGTLVARALKGKP